MAGKLCRGLALALLLLPSLAFGQMRGPGPLGPPLVYDNVSPQEAEWEKQQRVEEARQVIRQHMREWEEVERIKGLPAGHPDRQAWERDFVRQNPAWEFVPRNQWPDK